MVADDDWDLIEKSHQISSIAHAAIKALPSCAIQNSQTQEAQVCVPGPHTDMYPAHFHKVQLMLRSPGASCGLAAVCPKPAKAAAGAALGSPLVSHLSELGAATIAPVESGAHSSSTERHTPDTLRGGYNRFAEVLSAGPEAVRSAHFAPMASC